MKSKADFSCSLVKHDNGEEGEEAQEMVEHAKHMISRLVEAGIQVPENDDAEQEAGEWEDEDDEEAQDGNQDVEMS